MSGLLKKIREGSVVAPPIEEERTEVPTADEAPVEATEKTFWERRTPVIACGAGLFADGYNNAAIGPVGTLLGSIYGDRYSDSTTAQNISAIAFAGQVVGIIIFAYTSDHYSRKWSLFISTVIICVFAILSAGSYGAGGSLSGLLAALTAYRFLLGIGLGGEYPAGSVGCAESTGEVESGTRNRWFIWFTNLQIDFGFVVVYLVAMITVLATGENHFRAAWRIILGIGAIPSLSLLYMRFKLDEPEAFKRENMAKSRTPWWLILKFYWYRLTVVSLIWFTYDFCGYAFSIYSSSITDTVLGDTAPMWQNFGWATLINAFYLPGAIVGSIVSDKVGPRLCLIIFIILQAITGFVMAGCYGLLDKPSAIAGFCVVYGLFLSFGEAGPGDNIGLIAAKTSATPVRGQYYGVAAAIGKIGAFSGTYAFKDIMNDGSTPTQQGQLPFFVASTFCCVAALLAIFCLPHIGQDTIDEEDRRFRAYLREKGWEGQLGDDAFKGTAAASDEETSPTAEVKAE